VKNLTRLANLGKCPLGENASEMQPYRMLISNLPFVAAGLVTVICDSRGIEG